MLAFQASRSSSATSPSPLAIAISTIAVPPSSIRPKPVRTGAPERPSDLLRDQLAAELGQQRVQRALAAVGDRAQVGRHQPRAFEPAPDRTRDLRGVERALEGVGRDEDGTLGDRHGLDRARDD